jgi:stage V sporulation protein K
MRTIGQTLPDLTPQQEKELVSLLPVWRRDVSEAFSAVLPFGLERSKDFYADYFRRQKDTSPHDAVSAGVAAAYTDGEILRELRDDLQEGRIDCREAGYSLGDFIELAVKSLSPSGCRTLAEMFAEKALKPDIDEFVLREALEIIRMLYASAAANGDAASWLLFAANDDECDRDFERHRDTVFMALTAGDSDDVTDRAAWSVAIDTLESQFGLEVSTLRAAGRDDRLPLDPENTAGSKDLLAEIDELSSNAFDFPHLRKVLSQLESKSYESAEPRGYEIGEIATHQRREALELSGPNPRKESIDDVLTELDALIGLESVKAHVRDLIAFQEFSRARTQAGLPDLKQSLHLVFTGPPGTGKTSVARIIARAYAAIGILPTGHLVETGHAELIAGYVGQTALKVQSVVAQARGGVLFIDEAYSLIDKEGRGYESEAIATLLKSMEDYRGDMAVIAAGYADKMPGFINSNPGLKSRFTTTVDFPPYSSSELLEIFFQLAHDHELSVPSEARTALEVLIHSTDASDELGNARWVRNVFEQMTRNLASRAVADGSIDAHELSTFAAVDVPTR